MCETRWINLNIRQFWKKKAFVTAMLTTIGNKDGQMGWTNTEFQIMIWTCCKWIGKRLDHLEMGGSICAIDHSVACLFFGELDQNWKKSLIARKYLSFFAGVWHSSDLPKLFSCGLDNQIVLIEYNLACVCRLRFSRLKNVVFRAEQEMGRTS